MTAESTVVRASLAALGASLLWLGAAALRSDQAESAPQPAAATGFPHSWFGRWKGEARSGSGGTDDQRFTMELIVGPADSPDRFRWTTIYEGAMGRQERAYELVAKDAATGHYAIDERNGIVLEARLLDGGLYTSFVVQGTRVTTRERLEGEGTPDERLTVEMLTLPEADAVTTGNREGVPEVRTWLPRSLQRASLRRVREPGGPGHEDGDGREGESSDRGASDVRPTTE